MSEAEEQREDWEEQLEQIIAFAAGIQARRGGAPSTPPPAEVIRQMRQERTEQLEQALGPWKPRRQAEMSWWTLA